MSCSTSSTLSCSWTSPFSLTWAWQGVSWLIRIQGVTWQLGVTQGHSRSNFSALALLTPWWPGCKSCVDEAELLPLRARRACCNLPHSRSLPFTSHPFSLLLLLPKAGVTPQTCPVDPISRTPGMPAFTYGRTKGANRDFNDILGRANAMDVCRAGASFVVLRWGSSPCWLLWGGGSPPHHAGVQPQLPRKPGSPRALHHLNRLLPFAEQAGVILGNNTSLQEALIQALK